MMLRLPEEVGLGVLEYLEPYDLLVAAQVCRQFHEWAHDQSLWRRLLARELYVVPRWLPASDSQTPPCIAPINWACLPPPASSEDGPAAAHPRSPRTVEEWLFMWRELDRRSCALRTAVKSLKPRHRHFTVAVHNYLLPPPIAPLASLASRTAAPSSTKGYAAHGLQATAQDDVAGKQVKNDRVACLEDILEAVGFTQPEMRRFRDATAAEGWFSTQITARYHVNSTSQVNEALRALYPTSVSGGPAFTHSNTLYHAQKKHETGSGILIVHHKINALVFVQIGDFD